MAVTNAMADTTVGTAEELKTAIEKATDGETITLTAKITLSEDVNCSLTNGQSLTIAGDFSIVNNSKDKHYIYLTDGVAVNIKKSTSVFQTTADGKQVCVDRSAEGYTYAVATAVAKKDSYYFTSFEKAVAFTINANGFSTSNYTVELLADVTMTSDVECILIGGTNAISIKQGAFTLTPNGHKITLKRDIIGYTDKSIEGLFGVSPSATGCELKSQTSSITGYDYRYRCEYSKEAKIGDTEYETFASAAEAATEEQIIVPLKNGIPAYALPAGKTINVKRIGAVVEGNNHNYSVTITAPTGTYTVAKTSNKGDDGIYVDTYKVEDASVEITSFKDVVTYASKLTTTLSSGTYKLLKDIIVTANVVTTQFGNDVTIDLNGHTLTNTTVTSSSKYCFGLIRSGQKLTIKDSSDGKTGKVVANNCIFVDGSGNELNIEAAIEVNGDFAVATNGSSTTSGTINIKEGAKLVSNIISMYLPGKTDVNISGGTITGATGIYQKSGTLNITGGTITGNGAKAEYTYNGNGANATGDAVVIDNCGYPGGVPAPSITGGTFLSTNAKAVASYAYDGYEPVTGFVSAGAFNTDPSGWLTNNKGAVKVGDVWKVADVTITEQADAVDAQTTESYAVIDNCAAVTAVTTTSESTSVTIPANVSGNTVTSIAENAFEAVVNKDEIQSVDLSATSISGVEVSRTEGVFADFPEETLIYMPAGNTAAAGEKNVIIKDASDNLVCADFALTDERSYSIPQTFTATNVKLTRNFENGKTCTVCLPYALSTDGIDGTFYYFHSVEGTTVKMKQVTAANLTAYQPYIFVPSANASGIDKSGVNVTIAASAGATMTKGKEEGTQDFTFTGVIEKKTFTSEEIANGIYGFAAEEGHGGNGVGSFVKCSNGAYIEGLRAYLACSADLEATGSAAARSFDESGALAETLDVVLINVDGSATGIGQIKLINDEDGALYNIKGERLNRAVKGIVIKNGKKVLVK